MNQEEYIKELKELYERAKKEGHLQLALEVLERIKRGRQ